MGYRHIDNLYKYQDILLFKEVYACEKIHGTSSHISWKDGQVHLSPGGCKMSTFETIFDLDDLRERFIELGHDPVVVFGEQYGGKMQKMSDTYGKEPRFVAFEVKIGPTWLRVPDADDVAQKLGLEFVHYVKIPTTMEAIDAERDADSVQAIRNGMGPGKMREGVVLRPLVEVRNNRGERIMAKHKRDDFRETATPRKVGDPLKRLAGEKAAREWVTNMRMEHVLDKIPGEKTPQRTGEVIKAMLEDVIREGGEEVVDNKNTRKAISSAAAKMYQLWLRQQEAERIENL